MRRLIIVATLIVFLLVVMPPNAQSQHSFNVSVFPAKTELTLAPGSSADFEINLHNHGTGDQRMKIYVMDYHIKPDNVFIFKEPGHYTHSCSLWLSTDSKELTVPAGQVVKKRFTARVPTDAEPGGHHGVVFFQGQKPPGRIPLKAKPRLGSLVFITVPGEIIRKGEIKAVVVGSSWFWPSRKTEYRVVFQNKGNVHLTIRGRLAYTPTFGWGGGAVNLGEITVLPGTTRNLEGFIPKPPLLGSYRVKVEIRYGPSLSVFDTTKTGQGGFNNYPLGVPLLILFTVAIVATPFISLRRRGRRREAEAAREGAAAPEEDSETEAERDVTPTPEEGACEGAAPETDQAGTVGGESSDTGARDPGGEEVT